MEIIDRYYPAGSLRRDIYLKHCRQVADKALAIADSCHLDLDRDEVETAAMLHDIGIFLTDAPGIDCHGKAHYLMHGVLGAELLRREGFPEAIARVAERHTGAGITREDIETQGLPMPPGDYLPMTRLERLICYADKFFSKSGKMEEKTLERVRRDMVRFGEGSAERFENMHREFEPGTGPADGMQLY